MTKEILLELIAIIGTVFILLLIIIIPSLIMFYILVSLPTVYGIILFVGAIILTVIFIVYAIKKYAR